MNGSATRFGFAVSEALPTVSHWIVDAFRGGENGICIVDRVLYHYELVDVQLAATAWATGHVMFSDYKRKPLTGTMWSFIFQRDDGLCRICGKGGEQVDHIIPVCRGGRNTADNLWLLCSGCNLKKSWLYLTVNGINISPAEDA